MAPVSVERVAAWMLEELTRRDGVLPEDVASLEIVRLFGGTFCRPRADGSFAITRRVRDAFHRVAVFAQREVLWDEASRAWRAGVSPPRPYR